MKSSNTSSNSASEKASTSKYSSKSDQSLNDPSQISAMVLEAINTQLQDHESKLSKTIETQIENKITKESAKIERGSTEKVGIISTIIGLGIAYISVSAQQKDAFTTIASLVLTTTAFTVFATLIHLYFNDDKFVEKSKDVLRWAIVISGVMLLLSIIGQNGLSKLIFKITYFREPSQIVLFKQLFSINNTNPEPNSTTTIPTN